MAVSLLEYEVADLCLGKPPLRPLSVSSATLADALAALKSADSDNYISVWTCDHSKNNNNNSCRCIGKICLVDVICFLSKDENQLFPSLALKLPVSVLLPEVPAFVKHVEPSSSLWEAIDLMVQGAQSLVVPIRSNSRRKLQKSTPTSHNGKEFCWLTQEDMIRFLVGSIGLFSSISSRSIESLGIIKREFLSIEYYSPASEAVGPIRRSLADQTSVAVVDNEGVLIGEISPLTLACCDETVAAAITTLSAGDLMAYIDCGGPPEDLVRVVEARLKETNLDRMLEEFSPSSTPSNSSSDEEWLPSPTTELARLGGRRYSKSSRYSARMLGRSEAIVCQPENSLAAVMIKAITHRVNYVWVIKEDWTMVGIVTFSNILSVFRDHLEPMA